MSNVSTINAGVSPSIRYQGCTIIENRPPPPQESEAARIQKAAEKLAQEMIAKKIQSLQAEQRKRWAAFESAWEKTVRGLQADIQHQLIEMSMAVAERILHTQLPNVDMLRSVLEDTLAPISNLQGIRVRLSPSDLQAIEQGDTTPTHSQYIEWIADPSLSPGDVITESRNGIFDGRIKERLAVLAEALRDPARYAT